MTRFGRFWAVGLAAGVAAGGATADGPDPAPRPQPAPPHRPPAAGVVPATFDIGVPFPGDSNYYAPRGPAPAIDGTTPIPPPVPPTVAVPAPPPPPAVAPDDRFAWARVPPLRPPGPLGHTPVLPVGRGYYSLLDHARGVRRTTPPRYGYVPYGQNNIPNPDADFRYLDEPDNVDCDWLDGLKRCHLGSNWLLSTGGELRFRYMNEYNSRLTARDNTYQLGRGRVYADLLYLDAFRAFIELEAADATNENLPPLPIDEDRFDFLNLFVDAKLADVHGHPAYVRVGRQELALGSQRLVSPNDWANARQTFQGVRAFRHGDRFDLDVFWVQPVERNPGQLDSVQSGVHFGGVFATVRPAVGQTVDLYYLVLDDDDGRTPAGTRVPTATVHTLGGRYTGRSQSLLWDGEAAVQFGDTPGAFGEENIFAGMLTAGLGYHSARGLLRPTFWLYYDFASGDRRPTDGVSNTFRPLFPAAHHYLGLTDLVGRQNLHSINAHLYTYPAHWLTAYLSYYRYWLARAPDALYTANAAALRRNPGGNAGNDAGDEIDFVLNFHLTKHADLLVGYGYFFGGDFVTNTRGPGDAPTGDSSLFFIQTSYRW